MMLPKSGQIGYARRMANEIYIYNQGWPNGHRPAVTIPPGAMHVERTTPVVRQVTLHRIHFPSSIAVAVTSDERPRIGAPEPPPTTFIGSAVIERANGTKELLGEVSWREPGDSTWLEPERELLEGDVVAVSLMNTSLKAFVFAAAVQYTAESEYEGPPLGPRPLDVERVLADAEEKLAVPGEIETGDEKRYEAPERRAPVQEGDVGHGRDRKPPGTITWAEHLEVFEVYAKRYGRDQSAERIAERGGFGYDEIILFMGSPPKTWKPR